MHEISVSKVRIGVGYWVRCLPLAFVGLSLVGCAGTSTLLPFEFFELGADQHPKESVEMKASLSGRARLLAPHQTDTAPVLPAKREELPSPRLVITPEVERELDFILDRQGGFIWEALSRRAAVYPVVSQIFKDEGIPQQLINLALIESGFSPNARSRAGAVGMWQFMKATARLYGLRVTKTEDQRKDVVLSTLAAARHLRDLYEEYGDWYLALAAYNAGTGTVNRAMARAGSNDYWTLLRKGKIPRETKRYVPRYIASTLIVTHLVSGSDFDRAQFAQLLAAGGSNQIVDDEPGDTNRSASVVAQIDQVG